MGFGVSGGAGPFYVSVPLDGRGKGSKQQEPGGFPLFSGIAAAFAVWHFADWSVFALVVTLVLWIACGVVSLLIRK